MIHLVVPLRTKSQRIPEKIFAKVQGREILLRMADHAVFFQEEISHLQAHLAIDSEQAKSLLSPFEDRLSIHLTDAQLPSGTDRVFEVLRRLGSAEIANNSWIVNVQGDMPFLCQSSLAHFINHLEKIPARFSMATMAEPFKTIADYQSLGVVKVLVGSNNESLYFSRLPIPYGREALPTKASELIGLSHIGVYAYRAQALMKLAELTPHPIELAEGLEQLRALAAGIEIYAWTASPQARTSFRGIDLPADLDWANHFQA